MFKKLLNRILPSTRIKHDPARMAEGFPYKSLHPIPINTLKLIWPVAREIRRHRALPIDPVRRNDKKLTLIIPFRDRFAHLDELAPALRSHLRSQGIDYEILVVEQEFGKPFNRGLMINIGALEARKGSDYICYHDVDTVPLKGTDYSYSSLPLRPFGQVHAEHDISWMVNEDRQVYWHYFSGVIISPRETFERINGYSNEFWHWGSEDDDLFLRHLLSGITPIYDTGGRFRLIYHPQSIHQNSDGTLAQDIGMRRRLEKLARKNSARYKLYRRGLGDNSSGLRNCSYKVLSRREHMGCTIITVSV